MKKIRNIILVFIITILVYQFALSTSLHSCPGFENTNFKVLITTPQESDLNPYSLSSSEMILSSRVVSSTE